MSDLMFSVFFRRRVLLLVMFVLAVGLAVLLQRTLPRSYTVTNGVRIGRFMGVPLEMPEFTKQRFKMVGFLAEAYDAAGLQLGIDVDELPRTVKVSIENDLNKINNVDTLVFATRGKTPEQARAMSDALSQALIRVHGMKLREAQALREREIEQWHKTIEETESKLEGLDQRVHEIRDPTLNQASLFMLSAKLQENRNNLVNMMQVRNNVILQNHNPIESFNTEVISEVRAPVRASFPKLALLLPAMTALAVFSWLALCGYEAACLGQGLKGRHA